LELWVFLEMDGGMYACIECTHHVTGLRRSTSEDKGNGLAGSALQVVGCISELASLELGGWDRACDGQGGQGSDEKRSESHCEGRVWRRMKKE
jgi:hypothetical protein